MHKPSSLLIKASPVAMKAPLETKRKFNSPLKLYYEPVRMKFQTLAKVRLMSEHNMINIQSNTFLFMLRVVA